MRKVTDRGGADAGRIELVENLDNVFRALVILVICLFIMTRVIVPNITHVVGVSTAAAIVYYLYQRDNVTVGDLNKELEVKLGTLKPKPHYFHLDADFINLFYDIRDYRKKNVQEHDQALAAADNFLQLVFDVELGVADCAENLDVAKGLMFKSLNHLHSMVYSIPIDREVWRKYQTALDRLHLLFKRKLDYIHSVCDKQIKENGLDSLTQIRYNDDNAPRPNDTHEKDYNPHYNIY